MAEIKLVGIEEAVPSPPRLHNILGMDIRKAFCTRPSRNSRPQARAPRSTPRRRSCRTKADLKAIETLPEHLALFVDLETRLLEMLDHPFGELGAHLIVT
jgi:hypothetical protein